MTRSVKYMKAKLALVRGDVKRMAGAFPWFIIVAACLELTQKSAPFRRPSAGARGAPGVVNSTLSSY